MSIRCTLWVWEHVVKTAKADLSQTQLLVLLSLADRSDEEGYSFASAVWHGNRVGLSEKAVRMAAKGLVDAGLLFVEPRAGMTANLYLQVGDFTVSLAPVRRSGVRGTEARATPEPHAGTPVRRSDDPVLSSKNPIVADAPIGGAPQDVALPPKAKRPKPLGSRRCPANWEPSDADRAWAADERVSAGCVDAQLKVFKLHEFREPRKDWSAAFRKWLAKLTPRERTMTDEHLEPASIARRRAVQTSDLAGARLSLEVRRQRRERYSGFASSADADGGSHAALALAGGTRSPAGD